MRVRMSLMCSCLVVSKMDVWLQLVAVQSEERELVCVRVVATYYMFRTIKLLRARIGWLKTTKVKVNVA